VKHPLSDDLLVLVFVVFFEATVLTCCCDDLCNYVGNLQYILCKIVTAEQYYCTYVVQYNTIITWQLYSFTIIITTRVRRHCLFGVSGAEAQSMYVCT
jgi:hypothetical protein